MIKHLKKQSLRYQSLRGTKRPAPVSHFAEPSDYAVISKGKAKLVTSGRYSIKTGISMAAESILKERLILA
jgi:hypothetical protein